VCEKQTGNQSELLSQKWKTNYEIGIRIESLEGSVADGKNLELT
jgi:hypothetical protein